MTPTVDTTHEATYREGNCTLLTAARQGKRLVIHTFPGHTRVDMPLEQARQWLTEALRLLGD